jgi:hypothetical protein
MTSSFVATNLLASGLKRNQRNILVQIRARSRSPAKCTPLVFRFPSTTINESCRANPPKSHTLRLGLTALARQQEERPSSNGSAW